MDEFDPPPPLFFVRGGGGARNNLPHPRHVPSSPPHSIAHSDTATRTTENEISLSENRNLGFKKTK